MPRRIQKEQQTTERIEEPVTQDFPVEKKESPPISDDILDEIDEVLEENAQDFVNQFIQKGGE